MSKISDVSLFNSVFRDVTSEVRKKKLEPGRAEKRLAKSAEAHSLSDVVELVVKRTDKAGLSEDHELKILVRAVLAWEFGVEVLDDKEFLDLSEKILAFIKADETLLGNLRKVFGV